MTSPLLALFIRSLREEARAQATYWARGALAAFVLLVAILTVYWTRKTGLGAGAEGQRIFEWVVWLQWLAITLAGATWFSAVIAEEKEEDTLGLLRMTNLDALSILLGKSTSRLCSALLLLIAPFPYLLLTVTLGGVSLGQVQAVCATLLAYMFLLGNVALLWSVIMPTTVRAMIGTGTTLGLFYFSAAMFDQLRKLLLNLNVLGSGSSGDEFLLTLETMAEPITPLPRLGEILQIGFRGPPVSWHVWGYLGAGLLCFLLAWRVFTHFADRAQEGATAIPAKVAAKVTPALGSKPAPQRKRRRSRPWRQALAWKDFHFHAGGLPRFWARVAVYGVVILGLILGHGDAEEASAFAGFCVTYMPVAFAVEIAIVASRIFRRELREQTWSSLVLLPLTTWQITWRKLSGSLLALLPMLAASFVWVLLVVPKVWEEVEPQKTPAFYLFLGVFAAALQAAILTSYLIASLSLRLRRGALPLGLAIGFIMEAVLFYTVAMLYSFGGSPGNNFDRLGTIVVFGNAGLMIGNMVLHCVVLHRAERMAEEE